MTKPDNRLVTGLLAMPATTASTIYGIYDLFASAGRDWHFIVHGTPGRPLVRPLIIARDSAGFRAPNGAWIQPDVTLADAPLPELVCISDLHLPPGQPISGMYGPEIEWLRRCHRHGAIMAAACSGTMLLAESGLLDGCDATTHWGYCDALARTYPAIRVHPSRVLVASGDGQRIITAGGGTSWQDLALYLVARFFGVEEAMRLARVYLLDWHHEGQLPYASLARTRQVEDRVVAECQVWIARNYACGAPVTAMVERSGLPERTFKRRFLRATGMSPLQYVHTLRLEEAKQMLEATDLPVEAVAGEVGYQDPSFFGRLFRRRVGLTPVAYRRRFGSVRTSLQQAAAGAVH